MYDLAGPVIRTLAEGRMRAGVHTCAWNGRDSRGRTMPAGVYLARFEANGFRKTVKVIAVR